MPRLIDRLALGKNYPLGRKARLNVKAKMPPIAEHAMAALVIGNFSLLAVLLNARGTQSGHSVALDRALPGEKLLKRETVPVARIFKA